MPNGCACQATIDFEPLYEDALADETEGWDFLHDTVIRGLVEGYSMIRLVLDFALGPLLLLRRFRGFCWLRAFPFRCRCFRGCCFCLN